MSPLLEALIQKAQALAGSVDAQFQDGGVTSVEGTLRSQLESAETDEQRNPISSLLAEFSTLHESPAPTPAEADAQVLINDTEASAYLTLIPPRPGGRAVEISAIMSVLGSAGIRHGIDSDAIKAVADAQAGKPEIIWNLQIAWCTLPRPGANSTVEYKTRPFDKALFFKTGRLPSDWSTLVENVEPEQEVATIRPAREGKPGVSVRGEPLPPPKGKDVKLHFGDGLRVSEDGRSLHAKVAGSIILDDQHLDVVPIYVVTGNVWPGQNVEHNGHVLVTGSVVGPVFVRAEDIYVACSVEKSILISSGDVYVGAEIQGASTGSVEADGRVYARSISDTTIEALGDVVARNSITYSDVVSSGEVRVISGGGALLGGTISALRGIVARNVGSDFGVLTSTAAGVDFLSPRRLEKIERRIQEYENSLARINTLKRSLSKTKIDLKALPPDKQDMVISLFQKEMKVNEELGSLRRAKDKFATAIKNFLEASIRVLDTLHPPVKVQIGNAIEEIKERIGRVTLVLDQDNHIFHKSED